MFKNMEGMSNIKSTDMDDIFQDPSCSIRNENYNISDKIFNGWD